MSLTKSVSYPARAISYLIQIYSSLPIILKKRDRAHQVFDWHIGTSGILYSFAVKQGLPKTDVLIGFWY